MSRAFQCDHCEGYFNGHGNHQFKGEVCDKEAGFVRYRTVMFVYPSSGPPAAPYPHDNPLPPPNYESGGKELCRACRKKILLAALNGDKLNDSFPQHVQP